MRLILLILQKKILEVPHEYRFIIQLGKSLHNYGVPSYKIQEYLRNIGSKKNIEGTFMDLPTWINYAFYDKNGNQTYHYLEEIKPGSINFGALSKSVEIADKVINSELTYSEANKALYHLNKNKNSVPYIYQILGYGLSSLSFSMVINTNYLSCLIAFFLGLCVGLLVYWSKKSSYIQSTLESLSAFIVTVTIGFLSNYISNIHISITILSALIVYVPGLSITTSLEEITYKNLVSGTAKLFASLISLFKIFFGVALGITVIPFLISNGNELPTIKAINDMPAWISYVGMMLFSFSLLLIFQVRKRDFFLCFLMGIGSFFSLSFLANLGVLLSTFIGTIIVVGLSALFFKISNAPKEIYMTVGITMLVPGSKAFIGLSSLFLKMDIQTQNIGEQVALILMGIIGGLIFSGSFKKSIDLNA